MLTLAIQLKQEFADTSYTPQETGYWVPCLQASALFIQQLNMLLADKLIHGPLSSNPESATLTGFLGDTNTIPNEFGVVQIIINNYAGLKIPLDKAPAGVTCPFDLYYGDTSEQKQVGVDDLGNPIYETVLAGTFI